MYSNFIPKPYLQAKKGGSCCMAGASNDVSWKINTYTVAVSMHYFPKNEAVHCQKWIRFTGRHHKDFKPSNLTVLFSTSSPGPSPRRFQNGGSSGEDPGKGWVTWYKILEIFIT